MGAVRDSCFELVDHPPHSPDLARSEYFPFLSIKNNTWVGSSIGPMMMLYLQSMTFSRIRGESFYTTGIQAQQHRWKKRVNRRGDYVEK